MYEVGSHVVVVRKGISKYNPGTIEHLTMIRETKFGTVLRCYEGNENNSYHGSPWYSDCVDIFIDDGSVYTWDSAYANTEIMTPELLKRYHLYKQVMMFKFLKDADMMSIPTYQQLIVFTYLQMYDDQKALDNNSLYILKRKKINLKCRGTYGKIFWDDAKQ